MDAKDRRAEADAGDLGLEVALQRTVEMRDVGGSTTHVEADDPAESGTAGRFDGSDDAAGGAGEDRILAAEPLGGDEAAM